MSEAAGGLQEPDKESIEKALEKAIQQQAAEFKKVVAAAQEQMAEQVQQFQIMVSAAVEQVSPETPVYEAKLIDGGLWLNKEATDVLLQVLDGMSTLLAEIEKGK